MLANSLRPLVLAAVASLALGGTLLWLAGGSGGSQDFAEPGNLRFRNVTVELPPDSAGLQVSTGVPAAPGKPWLIQVSQDGAPSPRDESSGEWKELQIDAETGNVVYDTLSRDFPAAESIIASITVTVAPPTVWPWVDAPAPLETEQWGNIVYPKAPPESGVIAGGVLNYCTTTDCSEKTLFVLAGSSSMHIDARDGSVVSFDRVADEDRAMFERFAASVVVLPQAGAGPAR